MLGGGSAHFEVTQEENAPRLTSAKCDFGYSIGAKESMPIIPGTWSPGIFSGSNTLNNQHSTSFYVSSGEVRPRNKAVRIWKRTN